MKPPTFKELRNEKTCIFDREGSLIWRSPAWGDSPASFKEIADKSWHEFVYPDDLPGVLKWFKQTDWTVIEFRCFHPERGAWFTCWLQMIEILDDFVICAGENEQIERSEIPSPGPCCEMIDDDQ